MAYIQGDTVWLRATFYTRAGAVHDLTGVTCKVYADGRTPIGIAITGDDITKVSTGVYETPYVLPAYNSITYEFSGKDTDGNVQLYRDTIEIKWAD
jgi:hypothetical protein